MRKTITRTLGVLVLLAALAAVFAGCSDMIVSLLATTDAGADAAALSTDAISFGSDDTTDAIAEDFTLPTTGENGSTISWVSDNTDVIIIDNTTGTVTVTRPTDADIDVTLTATVTDDEGNIFTKTIIVTVLSTTDAGNDAAALGTDDIVFASGDSAGSVTEDFTLPTTGEVNTTTTISWVSGNTGVITIDNTTGTATVTRPATENAEVNLTATITDTDDKTSTKTITVTVLAEDGGGGGSGDVTSATGTLDTTFGSTGFVTHNGPADGIGYAIGYSIALEADGKILVTGYSNYDMTLWRYNSDGTLDTGFGYGNGILTHDNAAGGTPDDRELGDIGRSVCIDSDGDFLVTGSSSFKNDGTYGDTHDMVIWRYDSNGYWDSDFDGDGVVTHKSAAGADGDDAGFSIAVDADGKILVAGESTSSDSGLDMVIWRYNIDGTPDTTFNASGTTPGIVVHNNAAGGNDMDRGSSIALDSDGKILVAGESENSSGDADMVIWCYNSDGTLDTAFNADGTTPGIVAHHNAAGGDWFDYGYAITLDSSGRILVAGSSYDGLDMVMVIWRYNSDGTLDTSFGSDGIAVYESTSGARSSGNSIEIDPAGKILIAGRIESSPGSYDMALWRYTSDGTLDTSFGSSGIITHNNAAGGDGTDQAFSMALDSDGKVLVAGQSENSSGDSDMVIWRYE